MRKNNLISKIIISTAAALITVAAMAQTPTTAPAPPDKMQWWKDAKYGMTIYWGLYSVSAGEWKGKNVGNGGEILMRQEKITIAEYETLASQFNPTQFNADAWVALAKEAGMKYILFTAKSYDGFAMFKSAASPFNVVDATPFKRDVVKELADACRKNGIKFGVKYSHTIDWHHKGAAPKVSWDTAHNGNMDEYMDKISVPQIKELTTNYGQLDIFCFDNSNESKKDYAVKQKEAALTGQTNIIFNTKIGYNLGGDFETADNSLPVYSTYTKPWEANISHNGTNGFKTKDVNFKPAVDVLKSLIDVTSKGGNFVLNLGPDANGVIPAASAAQLKKVGKWLKVNGESVYGTTASPFTYLNWGKVTKKGMKLYVHVFDYPADGKIKLPITTDIAKSYLLTNPKIAVKAKKEGNYTTLQLPLVSPDSLVSVFVLDLKVEPISTITVPVPSIGKTVTSSSQDADAKFTITNVLDGLDRTVWKAGVGDINSFIEIDLGQETSIGAISIDEGGGKQVKKFKLEYKVGEEYKTVFEGTDVGVAYMKKFAPVKAQIFKLTFLEAKKELQIKDILLFFEE